MAICSGSFVLPSKDRWESVGCGCGGAKLLSEGYEEERGGAEERSLGMGIWGGGERTPSAVDGLGPATEHRLEVRRVACRNGCRLTDIHLDPFPPFSPSNCRQLFIFLWQISAAAKRQFKSLGQSTNSTSFSQFGLPSTLLPPTSVAD